MRKPIIAGNWKMNKTPTEAIALISALIPLVKDAQCDVVVCPPAACIAAAAQAALGSNIHIGAQNVHWAQHGAFTGEISADMLLALGVEYAVIGHSERRQYFGETDETVNKRAAFALSKGIIPIICVGESLAQREAGQALSLVAEQTQKALEGFTPEQVAASVIAYEPVWAIGTGKTATKEDANQVIAHIRNTVKAGFGQDAADKLRIQYGGSMNPGNVSELMAMSDIDGGLIGGASLKAEDFSHVVNY